MLIDLHGSLFFEQGVKIIIDRIRKLQFITLIVIYTFLSLTPSHADYGLNYNDKLMHLGGYIVAGISICVAFHRYRRAGVLIAGLFGYSLCLEIIQHFIPNRGFEIIDLGANLTGIILGVGLYQMGPWASPGHPDP